MRPVRILHTSDWHIGKTIRGLSRADEHREVLAEVVQATASNAVDIVIVAGDLYETAAPTAEAEAIAWQALLGLAKATSHVVVIAGNHDNPRRLAALRDLAALGNIHIVAEPLRPDEGGVLEFDIDGVEVNVAALPFVSKRGIVRADELMSNDAYENHGAYAERVGNVLSALDAACSPTAIRIMVAHGFVLGGGSGGGERPAHLTDEYALPAQLFPRGMHYVALGHLHRAQKVPGPTAIHYSGSILQLDFGDSDAKKSVSLVELSPDAPAAVTELRLKSGRALRTVVGTLDELRTRKVADEWLRVRVSEARRPELADEVRAIFGENCVDVFIENQDQQAEAPRTRELIATRTPRELYADYLSSAGIDGDELVVLFDELLAEVNGDGPEVQR